MNVWLVTFVLYSFYETFYILHRKEMSLKQMKVNLLRLAVNVIIYINYSQLAALINILLGVYNNVTII